MNPIAWALLMMLVLTLLEQAYIHRHNDQKAPWLEMVANLHSGHALLWLFRGVELWVYAFLYHHYHWLSAQALPLWAWSVLAFIAWDLSFYILHYCHHHNKWLWKIHAVHHHGVSFNLSLGIRNSWYSSLSSLPFFAWMAIVGVPPAVFLGISVLHYAIQLGNHNHFFNRKSILDRFFITAYSHRVHHATAPIYQNTNFGSCLSLWDKLFGTYQTQYAHTPLIYAHHPHVDLNPYHANHAPWFKPKHRPKPPDPDTNTQWTVISAVILFITVIFYVWYEYHWTVLEKLIWVALFTIATISLGQNHHKIGVRMSVLMGMVGLMGWTWSSQVFGHVVIVSLLGMYLIYTLWVFTHQKSVL